MDRDDDMDFTILGLLALERYGARFNSQAMAKNWMRIFLLGWFAQRNMPLIVIFR